MKRFAAWALACIAMGCSGGTEVISLTPPESFTGVWRSITAQAEFIRLTVDTSPGQQGQLDTRLTFSGVYWEGSGRVEGDSLVAQMASAGSASPTGSLIARIGAGDTLSMVLRSAQTDPLSLRFVRDQ
jgi:hypothetical protein